MSHTAAERRRIFLRGSFLGMAEPPAADEEAYPRG
jgi:hypothetical protein